MGQLIIDSTKIIPACRPSCYVVSSIVAVLISLAVCRSAGLSLISIFQPSGAQGAIG